MTLHAKDLIGNEYAEILHDLGPDLVIKLSDLVHAPASYQTVSLARLRAAQRNKLAMHEVIVSVSDSRPLPKFSQLSVAAGAVLQHVGRSTNMIELFLERK